VWAEASSGQTSCRVRKIDRKIDIHRQTEDRKVRIQDRTTKQRVKDKEDIPSTVILIKNKTKKGWGGGGVAGTEYDTKPHRRIPRFPGALLTQPREGTERALTCCVRERSIILANTTAVSMTTADT